MAVRERMDGKVGFGRGRAIFVKKQIQAESKTGHSKAWKPAQS